MPPNIPPSKLDFELEPGSIRAVARGDGVKTAEILMVPPEQIFVMENFNLRITGTKKYNDRVAEIAASISNEGYYQDKPITCYVAREDGADCFYVTDGHCRMAAIERIREQGGTVPERIPVIVKSKTANMADLTVAMFHTGEGLTPYERALGCKRLEGMGLSDIEICDRVHISKQYLDDMRSLLGVPTKLRNLLANDRISVTLALQEIREKGPVAAAEALVEADREAAPAGRKATRKTVEAVAERKRVAGGKKAAKTNGHTDPTGKLALTFKAKPGDTVDLTAIEPFIHAFNGDWYDTVKPGVAEIKARVQVRMKMTRVLEVDPAAGL